MMRIARSSKGRRDFLRKSGAVASSVLLTAWRESEHALGDELTPTPACKDHPEHTRPQTEGPFFLPRSPPRASLLEPGMHGTKIVLIGRVLSTQCRPVVSALVDFWQADDSGEYDVDGFRLRGHQFTDSNGRYSLETIVPGLYPGRTRHFHVKLGSGANNEGESVKVSG